jgi:hypothetical protein
MPEEIEPVEPGCPPNLIEIVDERGHGQTSGVFDTRRVTAASLIVEQQLI